MGDKTSIGISIPPWGGPFCKIDVTRVCSIRCVCLMYVLDKFKKYSRSAIIHLLIA